jgi:FlaA1/EpsC-like NDP-sugar epimerase
MKHIDIAEKNVHECISTNVDGIRNISTIFCRNTIPSVETIVFISTDKACAPINTYGMTKALGEKIIAELSEHVTKPKMVNVRYGNVINSRGSLIPLYNSIGQDPEKTHFPITNKDMTRFFMSLNESAELIEYAILHGEPGDTIIPREISAYKISDIASYFSGKYNKPVVVSSVRTGEKLHEALISYTETYRTIARDKYYIILPTYKPIVEERILQDELTSLQNLRPVSEIVNKF